MYPLLAVTLAPTLSILLIILYWDRKKPEPAAMLLRAFFYGILSTFMAVITGKVSNFLGLEASDTNAWKNFWYIFISIALAEEFSKWYFLHRLTKYPAFDEPLDGIVYGVMVALGFATLENFLYVYMSSQPMNTAIMRAFTAVPAHASFGAMMGFFTGARLIPKYRSFGYLLLAILLPTFFHATYNFSIMQKSNWELLNISGALLSLFIVIILAYKGVRIHKKISDES